MRSPRPPTPPECLGGTSTTWCTRSDPPPALPPRRTLVRRPRRGPARRRPGGAAPRLPRAQLLLARGQPLLHAQGHRTYAPDQRGYSPGARPRRRRDYTIPTLVGDVVALTETIGRPVHLVGHDWGATVGWMVAAHHPERVRSWTAVSVPHSAAMIRAWLTSQQLAKSWYMAAFQLPRVPERTAAGAGGRMDRSLLGAGMTPDDVSRFREEIVDYGALTGGLNWYRALPLGPPSYTAKRVRVPTTMVWSDGDTAIVRAGIDRTAASVEADYELVVLEGVSHWVPTQAPGPLAEAVLKRIASTP